MRILLPLRKVSSNKQSSNSSLSDSEDEGIRETASTTASESDQTRDLLVAVPPEEFQSDFIELPEVDSSPVDVEQQPNLHPQPPRKQPGQETAGKGTWKTTGLISASEAAVDNTSRTGSPLIRKRIALPDGGDTKSCKKLPMQDSKPPARDLISRLVR